MNPDKNALKAGLFIVVALLIGAGLLVGVQGSKAWFEPARSVTAQFDLNENLGGLKTGDPVRVGGVDQGRVTDITFVPERDNGGHMDVRFTLPKKFDLRQDAGVDVEQGLTGLANLNLNDFGRGRPWQEGDKLDGRPSAIGTLYSLAPEFKSLVGELRAKVGPAYAKYETTLDKADAAVDSGKKAMVAFADFLGGSGPDLRGTLANMNKATHLLSDRLPESLKKADSLLDDARKLTGDVHDALADAKAAMASAHTAIDDAHDLIVRNRSRIDHILASVRTTAGNLEGASAEVRRSPWRLLYQPSKDEVANIALYDATRQFAQAAAQLNDAAGAVRDAAADPGVDKKQVQDLLDDLARTFGRYREVEQVLWQSVK